MSQSKPKTPSTVNAKAPAAAAKANGAADAAAPAAAPKAAAKAGAKAAKAAKAAAATEPAVPEEKGAVAAHPVENGGDDAPKKSRQQATELFGINISPARCMTMLKSSLDSGAEKDEIKKLRRDVRTEEDRLLSAEKAAKEVEKLEAQLLRKREAREQANARKVAKDPSGAAEQKADTPSEKLIKARVDLLQKIAAGDVVLSAAERVKIEKKIADIKAAIEEKSSEQIRLSATAAVTTAKIADDMIRELIIFGFRTAKAAGETMLNVGHLHKSRAAAADSDCVEDLTFYPLIRPLPSFKNYSAEVEEAEKKRQSEKNRQLKVAREAKKKAAAGADGAGAAAGPDGDADEAEDGGDEHEQNGEEKTMNKQSFFTYVDGLIKTGKNADPAFQSVRVSNRVREHCAELVKEYIQKFSDLSRIVVQRILEVRTLNHDHIIAIVSFILTLDRSGVTAEERAEEDLEIERVVDAIREKVDLAESHSEAERCKKQLSLAPEKKAALEAKKREAEAEKAKKKLELAKKREQEAHAKVQELQGTPIPTTNGH